MIPCSTCDVDERLRVDASTVRRICVTGASGKAGRAVVRELLEHDFEVVPTDVSPSSEHVDSVRADLTDYGQVLEVLQQVDAVIHLANIPAPWLFTPAVTFNTNMSMNFNVFHAAARCGLCGENTELRQRAAYHEKIERLVSDTLAAQSRANAAIRDRHARLKEKYWRAARYPWLPVEPRSYASQ